MDELPDTPPRDIGSDLAEITSRLGEPLSQHQTNRARVYWRLILGCVLLTGSLAFHSLFWTRVIPWPAAGQINLWSHIIMFGLAVPLGGLALVTFALKSMRMCVLVYPTGLFVWHRGNILAFPWQEIDRVYFAGLSPTAIYRKPTPTEGGSTFGCYELHRSGGRLMGSTLTIVRNDGESASIPSVLEGFSELGERIQIETFARIFPIQLASLRRGETLNLAPFILNAQSLILGKRQLWPHEFDRVDREKENLRIFQKGKKRPWEKINFEEIANPHVLMGLLEKWTNGDINPAEDLAEDRDGGNS